MSNIPKPRITGEVREIPIDDLIENSWNPNVQSDFKYEHTRKVIREFGFMDPCTVRSGCLKGKLFRKLEIIDGAHRWRAAKEEGLTHVLVLDVGRMSDAKAMVLTDIMNNLRGENDPLKWAEMVKSIQADDEDLMEYLPYSQEEIDAMTKSTEVDWDAFDSSNPDDGSRDENGDPFKKFSVSLSNDIVIRAQNLMRKVKAAHALDTDAAAFEAILDGFEAYAAAQVTQVEASTASNVEPPPAKRRRRKAA